MSCSQPDNLPVQKLSSWVASVLNRTEKLLPGTVFAPRMKAVFGENGLHGYGSHWHQSTLDLGIITSEPALNVSLTERRNWLPDTGIVHV